MRDPLHVSSKRGRRVSPQVVHERAAADPQGAYMRAGYAAELRVSGRNLTGLCPFHRDSAPSFCITLSGQYAGRWRCFGCGLGGDIIEFYKRLHQVSFTEALSRLEGVLAVSQDGKMAWSPRSVVSLPIPLPQTAPKADPRPIPAATAEDCHVHLLARPKSLDWLMRVKGLPEWIIRHARIGISTTHWREKRFTIPVPYMDARQDGLLDIRGYRPSPAPGQPKMLPWSAGRGRPVIYPWSWVEGADELVWCEGELDALNLIARGQAAVTATCGVDGALGSALAVPGLSGKTVYVLGDHDAAGQRLGEKLPARLYQAGATRVLRLRWPDSFPDGEPLPKGFDLSDWCAKGATAEDVWRLIHG